MTPPPLKPDAPTQAFTEFYALEHEAQVRRAFLLLGDAGRAHDVVADAFIAVYQRWRSIAEPGPYLNRCVLNGCRDNARTGAREQPTESPLHEPATSTPRHDLGDVLLTLAFRQRAAIVLRFYGGFSEAEIATHLDCRPGTVGSLIHRGLRTLHHQLALEDSHD